ncbi:jg26188 [Pararge aegeria aegeria]|uniref:Jg26188 protein n=1 Tax=Pararge aegeria aegeria TaxID=348720 RepID=A0A8S4QWL8_9NEOP|nr:jg26188 [Pararge aegeria aegeria]
MKRLNTYASCGYTGRSFVGHVSFEPIPLGEDSAGDLVLTTLVHLLNSPRRDIKVYLRPWEDSRLLNTKAKQPHNDVST